MSSQEAENGRIWASKRGTKRFSKDDLMRAHANISISINLPHYYLFVNWTP